MDLSALSLAELTYEVIVFLLGQVERHGDGPSSERAAQLREAFTRAVEQYNDAPQTEGEQSPPEAGQEGGE